MGLHFLRSKTLAYTKLSILCMLALGVGVWFRGFYVGLPFEWFCFRPAVFVDLDRAANEVPLVGLNALWSEVNAQGQIQGVAYDLPGEIFHLPRLWRIAGYGGWGNELLNEGDFSRLEEYLIHLAARGLKGPQCLFIVGYTPKFLQDWERHPVGEAYAYLSRNFPTDWRAYLREIVRRSVRQGFAGAWWEIWNEPDYAFFWRDSWEHYLDLYLASVEAIKEEDPTAKVGGFASMAGTSYDYSHEHLVSFLERVRRAQLNHPGGSYLDFYSFHVYGQHPGDFARPGRWPVGYRWRKIGEILRLKGLRRAAVAPIHNYFYPPEHGRSPAHHSYAYGLRAVDETLRCYGFEDTPLVIDEYGVAAKEQLRGAGYDLMIAEYALRLGRKVILCPFSLGGQYESAHPMWGPNWESTARSVTYRWLVEASRSGKVLAAKRHRLPVARGPNEDHVAVLATRSGTGEVWVLLGHYVNLLSK